MLYADSLTRSYGAHDVLRDVSFAVNYGERVGLVGANGSGKTTLLRLLAGLDDPDRGDCGHKDGTLGYLPQDAAVESNRTLVDELWTAFPEARAVDTRLHDIASQLESGNCDLDALVEEQGELFHEFDRLDGYRIEKRIGRVLAGLGFTPSDWTRRCGDFSGGWRMRIALAKVMVHRPEHLLLDEPTNHLDTTAREWLAGDLAEYRGTILIVTHDAEFLDRVANRILELRDCQVKAYAGNYSDYQRIKAERLTALDQAAARQERELAKQQRFIDRFRAKQSKATVVKSREKAVAKIERVVRDKPEQDLHFRIEAQGRTEHDVLYMEHIGHAYGDNVVLVDVNLHVQRGQKLVFVGPNGSGKSTLLRIAAGQIPPSEGYMRWADKARRGYYDQHQDEALDPARTVLEEIESIAPNEREEKLRSVLGQFLFTGDDVHKPVRMLSGGERSRVALAKLVIQPTNVLILDEPTNHLDRSTRRRLLDVLESYDGTVLCAAHDPGLLDRVATRVYEVVEGACTELINHRREPKRKKSLGRRTGGAAAVGQSGTIGE